MSINEIIVAIAVVIAFLMVYVPYLSLTDLKHLYDIKKQLERIADALEKERR